MKRYRLVWNTDYEDEPPCLELEPADGWDLPSAKTRRETAVGYTLAQLISFLDDTEEDANHHALVGAHQQLAAILQRYVSDSVLMDVMRHIAEGGGLGELQSAGYDDA